jgi:hypothetical protein
MFEYPEASGRPSREGLAVGSLALGIVLVVLSQCR